MTPLRICLIGATNPSNNPRLLREADALAERHDVRVVCAGWSRGAAQEDARLLTGRRWRMSRVDHGRADWTWWDVGRREWRRSVYVRGRRRRAERAFAEKKSEELAEQMVCANLPELRRLAESEPADWFIAHAHPVLPVAAAAAERWKARLGFDCEDLLGRMGDKFSEANELIESRYLPRCEYVSATSQAMGDFLRSNYGVTPVVLYNVFPVRMAEGLKPPGERVPDGKLRLHWVGQTIGQDRGLEAVLEACTGWGEEVEIHLRGGVSRENRRWLMEMAASRGLAGSVKLHQRVHAEDVVKCTGNYDIGLALEQADHGNYSRTATNKLFMYLLAGLAVVATDVPGQREVLDQAPGAGLLYRWESVCALRAMLLRWMGDGGRERLQAAQQAAWDAARNRFCWDREQAKFLEVIEGRGL